MAINYTWDCKNVKLYENYNSVNNVIYEVHWMLFGEENGIYANSGGILELPLTSINSPDFVPIENLTESQVISWVETALGIDEINIRKTEIADMINVRANEGKITTLFT
jgi:hypothetical protein